jgi:curved DNA-binding protein CbpA
MRRPSGAPPMSTAPPAPMRGTATSPPPARRSRRVTAATREIEQLLDLKLPLLDAGCDHFTLLGLEPTASADDIRNTYFLLARKLHPDRLNAIGLVDDDRSAQRLMAQINTAFTVLNDPVRRQEYVSVLRRGGEAAVRAEEAKADELAMRVLRAEEAFKQGEMALRREQIAQAVASFTTAVELQPKEPEYQALLAWATFAAAADKQAIAGKTRATLTRAAQDNPDSPTARFYLGRVERILGREKEALDHFREVLAIQPRHAEASSEARVLEQRLKGKR